jgi:septum formation protein
MQFVLASASPRRRELLAELISTFEICPSNADENITAYVSPEDLVAQLAMLKAQEVVLRPEHEGKIVIGSDTVVAFEGEVLGKPKDEADAFRMLKMLSGKVHAVYTGVCFAYRKGEECHFDTQFSKTDVHFEDLSDAWIRGYIAGGSPMDKAGAYGIQDGGLVEKIDGSFTNVVGLPVELCKEMLKEILSKKA